MYGCFAFVLYVLGTHGGQKKASDSLGLDLQMFVSHCVGAENQTLVLWRSSQCSIPLKPSLQPLCFKTLSVKHIRIAEESTKMSILGICIKTHTNLSWYTSLCVWIIVLISWWTFILGDYLKLCMVLLCFFSFRNT